MDLALLLKLAAPPVSISVAVQSIVVMLVSSSRYVMLFADRKFYRSLS